MIVTALLMAALPACLFAHQRTGHGRPAPSGLTPKAHLKRAELAADRLVRQFHRTLDFGPVFDEMFVTDLSLRRRVIDSENELSGVAEPLEAALLARLYKSTLTLIYLSVEYKLTRGRDEVPDDVQRALPRDPNWFESNPARATKTKGELETALRNLDEICDLYRQHLPPKAFQSPVYKRAVRELRRRNREAGREPARVEEDNPKFPVPPGTPVYVVRRQYFDYCFIEEAGRIKLLQVDVLPDFTVL